MSRYRTTNRFRIKATSLFLMPKHIPSAIRRLMIYFSWLVISVLTHIRIQQKFEPHLSIECSALSENLICDIKSVLYYGYINES